MVYGKAIFGIGSGWMRLKNSLGCWYGFTLASKLTNLPFESGKYYGLF